MVSPSTKTSEFFLPSWCKVSFYLSGEGLKTNSHQALIISFIFGQFPTRELLKKKKKKSSAKYIVKFELDKQYICLVVLNNPMGTREVPKESAKDSILQGSRASPKGKQNEERAESWQQG